MVCPLIENVKHGSFRKMAYSVLGDNSHSQRCDKLMYAVIYLGVNVIGSAAENDYGHILLSRLCDYLSALCNNSLVIFFKRLHTQLPGFLNVLFVKVILSENLAYRLNDVLLKVNVHIGIKEIVLVKLGDICL